ncbi:MAG: MOSC domain-containing protein [Planctomycetota bacterium]|nr:MOSC domain-containing protein [Planctomycetota bacterium]
MTAEIVSVNMSESKGTPKIPVPSARLVAGQGIEGDSHAGPGLRQVSLLADESIDRMRARGFPNLPPGAFAENLTVKGIELWRLPVGTVLRVGDAIVLRVTQIGKKCHSGCAIFEQIGDCVMPREGIFVEVVVGGNVAKGDSVRVVRSRRHRTRFCPVAGPSCSGASKPQL